MPRFSILISVYNSEKYLGACLDSVLSQVFTDFEVVIVNDGSTDKSAAICDSYAEKDSRIRVLHMQNNGVFIARKHAEENCLGDLVLHVDSDDILDPELLSSVNSSFVKYDCDIVFFDFISFFPNGQTVLKTYFDRDLYFGKNKKTDITNLLLTTTFNSLCHKCFKRKLLKHVPDYDSFGRLSHGEDLLRSAYLVHAAESFFYLKKPLYRYRRDVGASARFSKKMILDSDKVICTLKNLIPENDELFNLMCRKQFNNFFRLLADRGPDSKERVKILRSARTLSIFKYASKAVGDTSFSQLRFKLIENDLCSLAFLLQKLNGVLSRKDR